MLWRSMNALLMKLVKEINEIAGIPRLTRAILIVDPGRGSTLHLAVCKIHQPSSLLLTHSYLSSAVHRKTSDRRPNRKLISTTLTSTCGSKMLRQVSRVREKFWLAGYEFPQHLGDHDPVFGLVVFEDAAQTTFRGAECRVLRMNFSFMSWVNGL